MRSKPKPQSKRSVRRRRPGWEDLNGQFRGIVVPPELGGASIYLIDLAIPVTVAVLAALLTAGRAPRERYLDPASCDAALADVTFDGEMSFAEAVAVVVLSLFARSRFTYWSTTRSFLATVAMLTSKAVAAGAGTLDELGQDLVLSVCEGESWWRNGWVDPSISVRSHRLSAIRNVVEEARELRLVDPRFDPTADITFGKREFAPSPVMPDDDIEKIRRWLRIEGTTRRQLVHALLECGATITEASLIRWSDIDLEQAEIVVGRSTVRERVNTLTTFAAAVFATTYDYLTPGDGDLLLKVRKIDGAFTDADHSTRASLTSAVGVAYRNAGVDDHRITPTSTRLWRAQRILATTGRLDAAARFLGHTHLNETARQLGWDWRNDAPLPTSDGNDDLAYPDNGDDRDGNDE